MPYQKFQATQLFTGTDMLDSTHVLVTDNNGRIESIIDHADAGGDIQQFAGILCPGFINCHCHLELSHMKGLVPEGTGLIDFVFTIVNERHFPDDAIAEAIAHAEDEMLTNGIVGVGDICNNMSTLQQKLKGRLDYYNFIEVSGWLPSVAQARFERSLTVYQAFGQQGRATARMQQSLSPHAPYSVSDELWKLLAPRFTGRTITIHNQETAFEDELFLSGGGDFNRMYGMMNLDTSFFQPTGTSSLQSYLPKMDNARQLLLVHNTFTGKDDLDFATGTRHAIHFCICINANLYIEKKVPPIHLLRENTCNLVIGTDSLASNHSLSVLDELKAINENFPLIPLPDMLQWATINGARALQMDDRLGSFEKGKVPGVLLLEHIEGNGQMSKATVKRVK